MLGSERGAVHRGAVFLPVLGIILLALGISLIVFCMISNKPETVFAKTVQTTTLGNYDFRLHAEENDWFEFDLNSSRSSYFYIHPYGPSICYGTRHVGSFQVNYTGDYYVTLGNDLSYTQVHESNTYSGHFEVLRQRINVLVLSSSGVAFVVVACVILLNPVISPLLLRPNVLAAWGHLLTPLRTLPKVACFFMLVIGTFLTAFGLLSLSLVLNEPSVESGWVVNATLFGFLLLATGVTLEMIRKKYSKS